MKSLILTPKLQQALIDGRKTQTRRIHGGLETIKSPDRYTLSDMSYHEGFIHAHFHVDNDKTALLGMTPKYQPKEIVYLREAYRVSSDFDKVQPRKIKGCPVEYKIGGAINCIGDHIDSPGRWRSPRYMPEQLARTFVRITDVKVERLLDISDVDCWAEGIIVNTYAGATEEKLRTNKNFIPRTNFYWLWRDIYGVKSWESNPWVFAYTFELCNRQGNKLTSNS